MCVRRECYSAEIFQKNVKTISARKGACGKFFSHLKKQKAKTIQAEENKICVIQNSYQWREKESKVVNWVCEHFTNSLNGFTPSPPFKWNERFLPPNFFKFFRGFAFYIVSRLVSKLYFLNGLISYRDEKTQKKEKKERKSVKWACMTAGMSIWNQTWISWKTTT